MNLVLHVALFLVVAAAIVVLGSFYSERDDAAALRSLPRRFTYFLLGCAALTAVMLVLEALFVSVP